jgi:putative transposase
MTRQRSLRVVPRDEEPLPWIQALKAEHPFRGYRRIGAYWRVTENRPVNKERIWRLRREHHLPVPPNVRLNAKRTPQGRKPKATKPHAWWGREMTQVPVEGVGWVSSVIGRDWYTKAGVGYYAGLRCTAMHWPEALDMAVNRQSLPGARGQGVSLMRDNGCQPTSTAFTRACATLEIHQAFTSDHNPKGKADTERFMRTRKAERLWLREWTCPLELMHALKAWLTYSKVTG